MLILVGQDTDMSVYRYLMYSPRAVQYIPIADIRRIYQQAVNQGLSGPAINRYMSNWFYSADYDIQHIYNA